ncbi:Hypothetical_protein [Hexamita inflata]|uniref:Hypothetical_protein n=1 Tax=Hexamita inflata TaxID=28002 RepID=A0AA86Q292_9EUKA|nr:Hypothetical protein HINF_LOCUS37603 [Hexamita inflata]
MSLSKNTYVSPLAASKPLRENTLASTVRDAPSTFNRPLSASLPGTYQFFTPVKKICASAPRLQSVRISKVATEPSVQIPSIPFNYEKCERDCARLAAWVSIINNLSRSAENFDPYRRLRKIRYTDLGLDYSLEQISDFYAKQLKLQNPLISIIKRLISFEEEILELSLQYQLNADKYVRKERNNIFVYVINDEKEAENTQNLKSDLFIQLKRIRNAAERIKNHKQVLKIDQIIIQVYKTSEFVDVLRIKNEIEQMD